MIDYMLSENDRICFMPFQALIDKTAFLPKKLHNMYIDNAENVLKNYTFPHLSASLYMKYFKNGSRDEFQDIYFKKRENLFLLTVAECLEQGGRFIEKIIDGLWSICEESTWVVPAHDYTKSALPDIFSEWVNIDLFSAETASALSWPLYFFEKQINEVTPLIAKRVKYEINKRVIAPYCKNDNYFWMGLDKSIATPVNNWNPWINSNILTALLITQKDTQQLYAKINRVITSLNAYISVCGEDGGCDEGPHYWTCAGAPLFDCLEMLFIATDGKINIFNQEKIKNIGRYIMRASIGKSSYVNFADGATRLNIPGELVCRYAMRIGDNNFMQYGISLLRSSPNNGYCAAYGMQYRMFSHVCNFSGYSSDSSSMSYEKDIYLPSTQFMLSRTSENAEAGFCLAAKGGHNEESHNHNDVGSFLLYCKASPVIIDVGVETYTAKTFGENRYSVWTMQSAYHNLPTINGHMQQNGRRFAAKDVIYKNTNDDARFKMQLCGAYPEQAGINSYTREFIFSRNENSVSVIDEFEALNKPELLFNFICACRPAECNGGLMLYPADKNSLIKLTCDKSNISFAVEKISIKDKKLAADWGAAIYRIIIKPSGSVYENKFCFKFTEEQI